jgi:hypothetical protein
MEDDAPLAIPLFPASPDSHSPTGTTKEAILGQVAETPAAGAQVGSGNVDGDGRAEAVGITMITGYLGAGKTTVSEE